MMQKAKVVLFAWVGAMLVFVPALIVFSALWWYVEVRTGGSWLSFDFWTNVRWAPVMIALYIASWKGMEALAGYVVRNHRDRVERFGEWLQEWYW